MSVTENPVRPSIVLDVNPPEQRRRAARYIASWSEDSRQCAELLEMLGLRAEDGVAGEE
jgi:hypothetical protein